EQLEQLLPAGILIRGKLALRRDDDGNESNQLRRFECIGIEPGDAFEPPGDEGDQAGADQGEADQANAVEPEADFPFGANRTAGEGAAPAPAPNDAPPADANGTEPPSANGAPPTGASGTPPARANDIPAKPKRSRKPARDTATEGGNNP